MQCCLSTLSLLLFQSSVQGPRAAKCRAAGGGVPGAVHDVPTVRFLYSRVKSLIFVCILYHRVPFGFHTRPVDRHYHLHMCMACFLARPLSLEGAQNYLVLHAGDPNLTDIDPVGGASHLSGPFLKGLIFLVPPPFSFYSFFRLVDVASGGTSHHGGRRLVMTRSRPMVAPSAPLLVPSEDTTICPWPSRQE
jgi:hypothetical protein